MQKVCCLQIQLSVNTLNKIKRGLYICKKVERPGNHDNRGDLCETLRERTRDYHDELAKKYREKPLFYDIDPWVQALQLINFFGQKHTVSFHVR